MSLATILTVTGNVLPILKGAKDDIKNIHSDLKEIEKKTKGVSINGSMTRFLNRFTIEPIAILSNDLKHTENIDKILELHVNLFTAYFTQVFELLLNVNGMDHNTVLDVMGTKKFSIPLAPGYTIEDRDYYGDLFKDSSKFLISVSHEDANDNEANTTIKSKRVTPVENKNISTLIQKEINVEITVTKDKVKHTFHIPLNIRLFIVYASTQVITKVIEPRNRDKSFSERLEAYRSGAISLSNLIFASDLIKEYKKNRISTPNVLNEMINNRSLAANTKATQTGFVGFQKFYNMLIVSNEAKAVIENTIRGKLTDRKSRELVMDATSSLFVTHVDEDEQRINIYTNDIEGYSSITYKSLSKGDKDNTMSELLKAFISGRPPVL